MSLRLRLLAAFAYVLVLVLVALELPLALNVARRLDAEVKAQAAGAAHVVAAGAADELANRRALDRIVRRAADDLRARVVVVDAQGRLLADSAGSGLRLAQYGNRPEIRAALAGRTAQGTRHSDTLDEDLLFTAVPVVADGRRAGAVRVTQSVDALTDRKRRDVVALVGIGAAALLLGLALAWLLASSLSRPLRALAETARRVGRGDLGARAEVSGPTEQREVAAAFNDMTERLAQVLTAQREFVANASHQLRTPLTGLRLRVEAARLRSDNPELEAAEVELDRLSKLLTRLLTLAREGERPPLREPTSLADAALDAVARWSARAELDGHRLELAGDGDVRAHAAEEDVAVMLDNLVENALNYTPSRGTIALDWGRDGDEAWLAVLDEGAGIAPGEEERVFERFARGGAGANVAGTGLGLPIVRTLARRWGGSAAIRNRDSGGARAEVRLPAAAPLPNADLDLAETLSARG